MFNLGFLHEREKIAQANIDKAHAWYRLAARSGYAAADYHLALLLFDQQPNDSIGLELLVAAADQGYMPALQRLGRVAGDQVQQTVLSESNNILSADLSADLSTDIDARSNLAEASSPAALSPTQYRGREWIKSQDSTAWTIQLLAFTEVSKVRDFIVKHQLQNEAAVFLDTSSSPELFKLIFGVYANKQQAYNALQSLSQELSEHSPWLRSIASVQVTL
jgi:septal ring-binding cell division protein DamX